MDIAAAHMLALQKMDSPGFHTYNIGTGRSYSVREICRLVERITGKKLTLHHAPRRLGDPAVLCASPKQLIEELDWQPRHSELQEIIGSAWQWEQAQCERLVAIQSR